jgi:DNA-binding GntR family transcriptional regulator
MPVREALRLLESEGLIINSPYKGAVVGRFTVDDIREIYQIRKLLEAHAAELAAQCITLAGISELERLIAGMKEQLDLADPEGYAELDRKFHRIIIESTGNRRLVKLIESIWKSFPLYLAYSIPGRIERSYEEQTRIVEAIRARDATRASALCCDQIETVYREMIPYFTEKGEEAEPDSAHASGRQSTGPVPMCHANR